MPLRTAVCCRLNCDCRNAFWQRWQPRRRFLHAFDHTFVIRMVRRIIYFLNECIFRFNLTHNAFEPDTVRA